MPSLRRRCCRRARTGRRARRWARWYPSVAGSARSRGGPRAGVQPRTAGEAEEAIPRRLDPRSPQPARLHRAPRRAGSAAARAPRHLPRGVRAGRGIPRPPRPGPAGGGAARVRTSPGPRRQRRPSTTTSWTTEVLVCRAHAAGLQGGRPGVLRNCGAPMPRCSTCFPTPRSSIASWQPSRAARGAAAHRGGSRPARGGAAVRVRGLRAVDKRSPRARGLRAPRRFERFASTGTPQPQPPSGSDTMAKFAHRLLRRAGGTLKRLSRSLTVGSSGFASPAARPR